MPKMRFQVSWHFSCGSGFPAAKIEAESLSHKKLTVRYTPAVAGWGAKMPKIEKGMEDPAEGIGRGRART
jgi:hypothetical protein